MKNVFFYLFVCFLPMLLSSCGDDDKEEPAVDSPIVGTWLWDDDVEPELYVFDRKGSFSCKVWFYQTPEDAETEVGTYHFDAENGSLRLHYDYEDAYEFEFYTVRMVGDKMYWTTNEGSVITLNRIN